MLGNLKAYFSSRTIWLAFGVGVLGLFQTMFAEAPIPAEYQGLITMGIGAAIAALRKMTTTPIGG